MEAITTKQRYERYRIDSVRSFVLSFVLFAAGTLTIVGARDYLANSNVHAVSTPDLILDIIPTRGMENFIVWGVPMLILFIISVLVLYPERIPLSLRAMGVLFFIRSFFILLTPLGVRTDQYISTPEGFFQRLAYGGNDFFFSGHVAFPFLFAMIFWDIPWIRRTMLCTSAMFALGVLLAHTHYSIDVFAVPFMIPTIFAISKRLFPLDPWQSPLPTETTAEGSQEK